jgi:hypothetical protein
MSAILTFTWGSGGVMLGPQLSAGMCLGTGLLSIAMVTWAFMNAWPEIQKYETSFFLTIESQWLLAGIILGFVFIWSRE